LEDGVHHFRLNPRLEDLEHVGLGDDGGVPLVGGVEEQSTSIRHSSIQVLPLPSFSKSNQPVV